MLSSKPFYNLATTIPHLHSQHHGPDTSGYGVPCICPLPLLLDSLLKCYLLCHSSLGDFYSTLCISQMWHVSQLFEVIFPDWIMSAFKTGTVSYSCNV